MAECTREQIVATLVDGWGKYVENFRCLSPQDQQVFLKRQGYDRLSDLLAHVIVWWTDGSHVIRRLLTDPQMPDPQYDVDAFNARAVEKYHDMDEAGVVETFEDMRSAMLNLVQSLPDEAFCNERIQNRLAVEVIGHLKEHELLV